MLEIVHGTAFKGSRRSQDFLKYIVEKKLHGNLDALKERIIGVELFGRAPDYATADDAIVRVTASDVRRRLLQHYGEYGSASGIRIELPAGTYIPEFHYSAAKPRLRRGAIVALAVLLAAIGLWKLRAIVFPSQAVLPWSVFFAAPFQTTVVTSDTDLVEVQDLTGVNVLLSDYANRKYIPNLDLLDPATRQLCTGLRGDHCASVDTAIALLISGLARSYSQTVHARGARSLTLSDFQSDDNFIFLGSPRSNPWSALFDDQLDFTFDYDRASKREVIRNKHPRSGEAPLYIPTALGWETGQAFAIVAFVSNPNQKGHVLVLAGSNAEGTQSAANFVADLPLLAGTLERNGIRPAGEAQPFEALLRLRTLAGSARAFEVLAFHRLPQK